MFTSLSTFRMRGSRQLSNARPTSATLVSHSGSAAAMVRLSATNHLASDEAYGRIGVRLRCSDNGLRSSESRSKNRPSATTVLCRTSGSVSDASSNEIGDDVGDTDLLMTTSFAGNTVYSALADKRHRIVQRQSECFDGAVTIVVVKEEETRASH